MAVAKARLLSSQSTREAAKAMLLSSMSENKTAQQTGVNRTRIYQARQVLEYAPDVADSVLAGAGLGIGELWKARPKNEGQLSRGSLLEPRDQTPTLAELGKARPKNKGAEGTGSNQYEVRFQKGTTPPTLAELAGKQFTRLAPGQPKKSIVPPGNNTLEEAGILVLEIFQRAANSSGLSQVVMPAGFDHLVFRGGVGPRR